MPIIPVVGRRSLGTRALLGALYLLLALGAVTMIYPFALMLSTATTGNADWRQFRIIPAYWTSEQEQFRKMVVDKAPADVLAFDYGREDWFTARDIDADAFRELAEMDPQARATIDRDFADFIGGVDPGMKHLYYLSSTDRSYSVLSMRNAYFDWLRKKYDGDLEQVNLLYDDTAERWHELGMQRTFTGAWEPRPTSRRHADWQAFVASRSPDAQRLFTLDGLVFAALRRDFGTSDALNRAYGTEYESLIQVRWDHLPDAPWADAVREGILRRAVPLEQIRLRDSARLAFDAFVQDDGLVFSRTAPTDPGPRAIWMRFVRAADCRLADFDPDDPLRSWQAFLRDRYENLDHLNTAHGESFAQFDEVALPIPVVDYEAFRRHRDTLMWRFLFGNFGLVLDVVLLHGRALMNTLVFIVLMIVTTLTVNPMAAYVLSRYPLRHGEHLLVFLLATMAFPVEMVMIPNFLLVKQFPLAALVLGVAALAVFLGARRALRWNLSLPRSLALGGTLAVIVGLAAPPLAARLLGRADMNVSLMNTFFALVLPGVVNGYWIFLLKGFFDSLPPELYEAGMLDGASERRMFLSITMPMCKPVLAVIALGAFTAAYGAFMFAFLTCQDPQMWTLMVFLYQFQQQYGVPQVMASLVIAAVPTLVVFILCQRVILRGIVVPTFT
ncbi:MAG: hypothetical protein CMJ18_16680 [Phycisphaeraceae bacterium]|nr:hypothetical protein [Phycisphaeraceae bacterium]